MKKYEKINPFVLAHMMRIYHYESQKKSHHYFYQKFLYIPYIVSFTLCSTICCIYKHIYKQPQKKEGKG